MRLRFVRVFIPLLVFLSSCSSFKEPIIKGSNDFKLTEFQGKKVSFSINIAIENNNWYALKIKSSNVDVFLEEKNVGKLFLIDKVKIPAKKTSVLTIPARLELADGAFFIIMKSITKENVPIRFNGKIKGGILFIYKNFTIDEKTAIPGSLLKFDNFKFGGAFGLEK
jgi:LEA14-like dessication related protein